MTSKTIWIIGGGSGIGRGLAQSFARDGHRVAISGRSGPALGETAAPAPDVIRTFPLDITQPAEVDAGIAAIEEALGPIELVVLSAGIYRPVWVADFDRTAFRDMVETNLIGVANVLEPVLKRMRERRAGQIAIIASVAGYGGLPGAAAYGASKAALINMAEALRPDAARHGIRVQVINPGFVKTPLTAGNSFPMPFLIEVDEAVRRIRAGLETDRFEIAFPRRFAALLKLARLLPYSLYFKMTARHPA